FSLIRQSKTIITSIPDPDVFGPGYQDVNIRENEVYGNGHEDMAPQSNGGILLAAYENCTLEGNHLYNNTDRGIAIQGSENTVIGNTVYNTSGSGIEVIMVFDCLISENMVYDCEDGILLYSIGSNATGNIVYDNEVGIYLYGSQSCYIYGNDVGWNNENALEEGGMLNNMWYNDVTEEGNHWHDYNGVGIYWISNGTHSVTSDDYPSISLNLTQANSISYEILETGNFIEWDAYALNPSHYEVFVDGSSVLVEDWDGNNIEYLADGLSHGTHTIEVIVYHISGHSMNNLTTADVEDLTPPDLDGPTIIETTVGGFFNVQYTASDPSGIASWAVNDTRFVIDSSGVLSRVGDIPAGEHVILIQVTDTLGHTASLEVSVLVSGGGIDTILALSLGGGAIVVLIVVIVFLKKKQT
ncbi:MAG: NosD domain-containing protein, partial [Candidatus Thorarchaeota archaeon]